MIRPENSRRCATCRMGSRRFPHLARAAALAPPSSQIPVGQKPCDGIGNPVARGTRLVTDLARSLGRAEIHPFLRHPNAVHRDERVAPGNAGRQFGAEGDRKKSPVRNTEPRWAPADRVCDLRENFGFSETPTTENIPLADPPLL